MFRTMSNLVYDLVDTIKYGILQVEAPQELYPKINTELSIDISSNGVFAISKDLQGLLVSADTLEELPDALIDAWFKYYDIPRYQARKAKEYVSISLQDGRYVVNQTDDLNYAP